MDCPSKLTLFQLGLRVHGLFFLFFLFSTLFISAGLTTLLVSSFGLLVSFAFIVITTFLLGSVIFLVFWRCGGMSFWEAHARVEVGEEVGDPHLVSEMAISPIGGLWCQLEWGRSRWVGFCVGNWRVSEALALLELELSVLR